MTTVWDVAVGVCLLYLLIALIVTTLQELIASFLRLRATHLYESLAGLLVGNLQGSGGAEPLVRAFYQHPLIRNLGSRLPSYIPSQTFALALVDVLRGTKTAAETVGATALLSSTRDLANSVSDPDLRRVLTLLLGDAEQLSTSLNERARLISERIEAWFNDRMARASGSYKRRAQLWSLGLSLVVSVALNADTLHVVSRLWADEALRAAVVASAQALNGASPADGADVALLLQRASALADSSLPVGWHLSEPFQLKTLLGWLITALAVSLGANFWFDMLNKALRVRGTGLRVSAVTGRVEARAS